MQELHPGEAGRRQPAFAALDLRRPKGYTPPPLQPPAEAEAAASGDPCPRCESTNTKFCYYNNYNTSQPRHFCKSCRRYWTKGGTLRNVPVGGGSRKSSSSSTAKPKPPSKRRRVTAPESASNSDTSAAAFVAEAATLAAPANQSTDTAAAPAVFSVDGSFTSLMQSGAAATLGLSDPGLVDEKPSDPNAFEWPALFDLGSYWNQSGFSDADPALFLNLP